MNQHQGGERESGQAIAEFVISAITFLFVILTVIQLALVLNAYSLVRYAAYNAARAGIVHSADQSTMEEAARISLLSIFPGHGRADHVRGVTDNYLAARLTDHEAVFADEGRPITEVTVLARPEQCGRLITFDDPSEAKDAVLTVQVVHRYQLVIPLTNRIFYWVYRRFRSGEGYQNQSVDALARITHQERLPGRELHDIEYRIPLVAHYTMRMQSDFQAPQCAAERETVIVRHERVSLPLG